MELCYLTLQYPTVTKIVIYNSDDKKSIDIYYFPFGSGSIHPIDILEHKQMMDKYGDYKVLTHEIGSNSLKVYLDFKGE